MRNVRIDVGGVGIASSSSTTSLYHADIGFCILREVEITCMVQPCIGAWMLETRTNKSIVELSLEYFSATGIHNRSIV